MTSPSSVLALPRLFVKRGSVKVAHEEVATSVREAIQSVGDALNQPVSRQLGEAIRRVTLRGDVEMFTRRWREVPLIGERLQQLVVNRTHPICTLPSHTRQLLRPNKSNSPDTAAQPESVRLPLISQYPTVNY